VAATCIFLATKVEENPRKLPDLITASARFSQRNWELEIDEQNKEYWKWRDAILFTEEYLLEALCFDFDITHPYDDVVQLVQRLAPGNSGLGKYSWTFVNDRYYLFTIVVDKSSYDDADNVSFPRYRSCGILF